ncbi:MAG: aminopeptidase P family protein [Candidatus Marinimicrobia bacterium]|nr:aminopeptidase P family protein [Candidatus Neomarinimicrobiota bacterium]
MFNKEIYIQRRTKLIANFNSGLLLFPGNLESPMNYADNTYRFRQDSNFLYFFGLDEANHFAVIDLDHKRQILFGDDYEIDDIIWMGPQPKMLEKAASVGITDVEPKARLAEIIQQALDKGREIHFLPPYRGETKIQLAELIGFRAAQAREKASEKLIKAVVAQRSIKSREEIAEIENAIDIAASMHVAVMKACKPGMYEYELAGALEGVALGAGSSLSFSAIVTHNGQTLHNHHHGNKLEAGRLLINDSGCESEMHYAADITRTYPISGKFTEKQKAVYNIVLKAETEAIKMIKPGIKYKTIHLAAAKIIATGLKELGLMKGNTDDAVEAGAHALFFPHGLGHMMGLDVHDMEGLGENFVGYDENTVRSTQFGTAYLRLGKELQTGNVLTVEPGCYFIPELIDLWKSEGKHTEFINYEKVEEYHDFGGIRIEDDVLVTETGQRVLGTPIPKTVEEIEAL